MIKNKNKKRIFRLRCKYCGNYMNYSPKINFKKSNALIELGKKRKHCVYCGKSFAIKDVIRKVD